MQQKQVILPGIPLDREVKRNSSPLPAQSAHAVAYIELFTDNFATPEVKKWKIVACEED